MVSLPAFAMTGLRRGDARAAEAAVKFFLVSVVSTAVMLMGVSLRVRRDGSVFLEQIDGALAGGIEARQVAVAGTLLTVVGLAFKVAAVPFHMWVPDTYVGAPVAVAAYLSVVSKAAGFVGLILVLAYGLGSFADVWAPVRRGARRVDDDRRQRARAAPAARDPAAGVVVGGAGRLHPGAVRRGRGRAAGSSARRWATWRSTPSLNLSAFAVAAVVGTRYPAQRLADYRGLVRDEPGAGWPLAFALVALAGLPPGVIGLLAKVVVLDAAAGPATWLAVVMALNVAIGLVYYARWLAELFRPSEVEGASRYDVPNGRRGGDRDDVHRRCGVLGVPRLAARPRARRPPVVRDGLQVPLRFFLHSVTDYPDGRLRSWLGGTG